MAQRTNDDQPKALPPALESMTLLVAALIVHDKATNRVVLLQRSQNAKFAQGMWDLPVGKSEPGEPITETAVRELYEETGLIVKPESLKVAHIIHSAWGVEAPNGFLTVVFAAHDWTGEPENREPRKHAQVCRRPRVPLTHSGLPVSSSLGLQSRGACRRTTSSTGWAHRWITSSEKIYFDTSWTLLFAFMSRSSGSPSMGGGSKSPGASSG